MLTDFLVDKQHKKKKLENFKIILCKYYICKILCELSVSFASPSDGVGVSPTTVTSAK